MITGYYEDDKIIVHAWYLPMCLFCSLALRSTSPTSRKPGSECMWWTLNFQRQKQTLFRVVSLFRTMRLFFRLGRVLKAQMFALCRKANRRLRLAALQTCGIALVFQRTFWTAIGSMILGGGDRYYSVLTE